MTWAKGSHKHTGVEADGRGERQVGVRRPRPPPAAGPPLFEQRALSSCLSSSPKGLGWGDKELTNEGKEAAWVIGRHPANWSHHLTARRHPAPGTAGSETQGPPQPLHLPWCSPRWRPPWLRARGGEAWAMPGALRSSSLLLGDACPHHPSPSPSCWLLAQQGPSGERPELT